MNMVFLIIIFALLVGAIVILVNLIYLDKEISEKLKAYRYQTLVLENNCERVSERLELLSGSIYNRFLTLEKRISLVEKIKNIDLSEFTDKLKADFQNEIFVENMYGCKANIQVKDVLLSSDLYSIPNSQLEKVLEIYATYCDKLYTLEKYSKKENAKRPVGRPRKEK